MKYLKFTCLLAGGLLLLSGNHSQAQYTITGTTSQGGNVVTGTGATTTPLGPGSPLSATGFDQVTLEPGFNLSSAFIGVQFQTSNNSLLNLGVINTTYGIYFVGTSGSNIGNTIASPGIISIPGGGRFVLLSADAGDNGGNTITNSGTFTSNAQGSINGIEIVASGNNTNNTILNSGSIGTGGGSNLIYVAAGAGNSGNHIINSGIISTNLQGGSTMVQFGAAGDSTGNTILNTGTMEDGGGSTIFLMGANGNNFGNSIINSGLIDTNGGSGNNPIIFYANSGINSGNLAVNSGTIITDGGGSAIGIFFNSNGGANIGNTAANSGLINLGANSLGIDIQAATYNTGNIVTNSGLINTSGGSDTGIYMAASSGNNTGNTVTNSGSLILAAGSQGIYFNTGASNLNNTVVNSGQISSGGGVNMQGIYFNANSGSNSGNAVANSGTITLLNNSQAILFGATAGNLNNIVTNSGLINASGANGAVGVLLSGNVNTGNSVINSGVINAGAGGQGVEFAANAGNSGNSVVNLGNITAGAASTGIYFITNSGNNTGNTVTNWGVISAAGGTAISISNGIGNVVNLNGHSSTIGKISISGVANSNVVNLNFSGVSAATIHTLKPLLLAQGVNSGVDAPSVTFTLRGVTYNIDPAKVYFNVTSYQLQGLTPNQAAIGASLDSIPYNPAPGSTLSNFFNAIDASGNVPGALESLSPEKFAILGDLAIANADFTVASVDARLNNVGDGSESINTGGGVQVGALVAGDAKDDSKDKGSGLVPPVVPGSPDRWGFFASGDGLFFRGNQQRADTAGTIVGVDAKAGDHSLIGVLFGYSNSAVTLGSDASHATIETYTGGLYGSWRDEGFYVNGLAAYTRNNYRTQRNIAIAGATANGSTDGNQATANLDGGYDFNPTSHFSVGPIAGVQYVHLDIDGFNESGAGIASLAVGSQSLDSLQSRLGLHASYHTATSDHSSFALDLHAAWRHEFLDDSRAIGANFEGAGLAPFAVQTASPLRDAAVVGLGVNFTFHDTLTLFTQYELEFWRSSYFEQTISGGARISF